MALIDLHEKCPLQNQIFQSSKNQEDQCSSTTSLYGLGCCLSGLAYMCFEQSLVLLLAWRQTDKLIPDEPMATPMSYAIREQGSISQTIFFIVIEIRWKFIFCSNPIGRKVIDKKFCTWHDSCAVVTCAKFCSDMVTYNRVTLKYIFDGIWIVYRSWNGPQSRKMKLGYRSRAGTWRTIIHKTKDAILRQYLACVCSAKIYE